MFQAEEEKNFHNSWEVSGKYLFGWVSIMFVPELYITL
jgi:hypothetical protein